MSIHRSLRTANYDYHYRKKKLKTRSEALSCRCNVIGLSCQVKKCIYYTGRFGLGCGFVFGSHHKLNTHTHIQIHWTSDTAWRNVIFRMSDFRSNKDPSLGLRCYPLISNSIEIYFIPCSFCVCSLCISSGELTFQLCMHTHRMNIVFYQWHRDSEYWKLEIVEKNKMRKMSLMHWSKINRLVATVIRSANEIATKSKIINVHRIWWQKLGEKNGFIQNQTERISEIVNNERWAHTHTHTQPNGKSTEYCIGIM